MTWQRTGRLTLACRAMSWIVVLLTSIAAWSIGSAQAQTSTTGTTCTFGAGTLRDAVDASSLPREGSGDEPRPGDFRVHLVQDVLNDIYGDKQRFKDEGGNLTDGRLGPRTSLWINMFCSDFKVLTGGGNVRALIAAFIHYQKIRERFPDWAQRFFDNQLSPGNSDAPTGQRLRWQRSGPAAYAIDVLEELDGDPASSWLGDCSLNRSEGVLRGFDANAAGAEQVVRAFQAFVDRTDAGGMPLSDQTVTQACNVFAFGRMPSTLEILGDAIDHYSAIEDAVPLWREILDSPDFDAWVRETVPHSAGPDGYRALRRAGTAPIVIALLQDYLADQPDAEVTKLIRSCAVGGQPTQQEDVWENYYLLGEDRLAQMEEPAAPIQGLIDLVGKNLSRQEFAKEVRAALTDLQSVCPQAVFDNIVAGIANRQSSGIVLNEDALSELATTRLPERSLAAVGLLEDIVFEDPADLRQAVTNRLEAIEDPALPAPASNEQGAPADSGDVDQSTGMQAPAEDAAPETASATALAPTTPRALLQDQQIDIVAANAQDVFQLTKADADAVQAAWADVVGDPGITEDQSESLGVIADVAYPNRDAFDRAISAAVNGFAGGQNPLDSSLSSNARQALITTARRRGEKPFPAVTITTTGCGCAQAFAGTSYGIVPSWLGQEATPPPDDTADGAEAGSDDLPPIYNVDFGLLNRIGFIDTVLRRNGSRDPTQIWETDFDAGGFIARAHRHNTRVDMVVRTIVYDTWQDDETAIDNAVATVVRQFDTPRKRKRVQAASILEHIEGWFSVERFHNTRVDGVTMLFEDFGTGEAEKTKWQGEVVEHFIKKLRAKLDETHPDAFLNLGIAVKPERAEATLAAAKNIIINSEDDEDLFTNVIDGMRSVIGVPEEVRPTWVDLVLIYLPEATTDTKKDLRYVLDLSQVFRGEDRRELLRRMQPIIPPNGHRRPPREVDASEFTQFNDDLIYFRDNFDGIAFWPLPSQDSDEFEDIKHHMELRLSTGEQLGNLAALGASGWRVPICEFVCPNRKLFHFAYFGVAGLTLGLMVVGWLSCSARTRLARIKTAGYILVGVVLVLISLLMLACDPSLRQIGDAVALLAVVLIVAILGFGRILALQRGPMP